MSGHSCLSRRCFETQFPESMLPADRVVKRYIFRGIQRRKSRCQLEDRNVPLNGRDKSANMSEKEALKKFPEMGVHKKSAKASIML